MLITFFVKKQGLEVLVASDWTMVEWKYILDEISSRLPFLRFSKKAKNGFTNILSLASSYLKYKMRNNNTMIKGVCKDFKKGFLPKIDCLPLGIQAA